MVSYLWGKVSYKSLINEIYLGDYLASGMIGGLPEEPKEEVRIERVHPHDLDHFLECHTDRIEWMKTDDKGRITRMAYNGFHGKVIYEVQY